MTIVGTFFNCVIICLGLRFGAKFFWGKMNWWHCLTFAVIISAIDAGDVVAIYEAVDADKSLYFLVNTLFVTLITLFFVRSTVNCC